MIGTAGVNSFIANTSSPRACMDAAHISQRPSLLTPDEPLVQTGIEYELGKYINDVRAEHDYIVKAIIPKYREFGYNPPVYTVLVEYEENGQLFLDYIDVETYRSTHGFFGFTLTTTDEFNNLTYNSVIPKDTILAKTASLSDSGAYKFGLNVNMAFMSHPSVSEDGFVVSKSFIERAKFTSISKRIINITKDNIPLNVHGDETNFKFIPNIGEMVREDGLLCALRQRNDWFSISDLSNSNLREVDSTFDTSIYTNPGSVVIDVNVIRGNYNKSEFSSRMTEQLDNYASMLTNYYQNVVNKYDALINEKKAMYGSIDVIRFTPRLHRFITDAMIRVTMATNGKNKLCYRKLPIDQYRIEVTVLTVIKPDIGYKMSDISAAKGVICRILPDEAMPVDEMGNRADVITDSMSTISRMNLGRSYQAYISATARDSQTRLRTYFFNKYGQNYLNMLTPEDVAYFIEYVHGLYSLINPSMVNFLNQLNFDEQKLHLIECLTKQLTIYYPPDNAYNITDVIDNIEKSQYKPHLGKVNYIDELGCNVTTKEDVRIGQLYIMMLEKIANDYSGVSSARVNNFGFPVKGTNIDKHKYPHSLTPTKTLGETEVRILRSFADPAAVSDLFDITLNPVAHKLLIKHMLESDKPFDPEFNIDRNIVEYGQTKSLSILNHVFTAAGFTFEYQPEN
jgi:DNA-directed RNA polymerase beta subunit